MRIGLGHVMRRPDFSTHLWPPAGLVARLWTAICWAAVVATALPSSAHAFCRSHTCVGSSCPTDDNGCPSSGAALWWAGSCIGFSIEANGSRMIPAEKLFAAVRNSFKTWSQVDCGGGQFASITFAELAPNFCDSAGYLAKGPNVNAIIFQDDDWKFKTENNVAKTSAHFDTKTGEIYDADLEINTAVNLFTTDDNLATSSIKYLDLQTVITHEVGHMIGIAHSDRVDSIMYPYYMQGTLAGRKLTDDDVAAVCAIYPPTRKAVCDPSPLGGLDICRAAAAPSEACAAAPRPSPGSPQAAGLAMLSCALAVLWRRRRAAQPGQAVGAAASGLGSTS